MTNASQGIPPSLRSHKVRITQGLPYANGKSRCSFMKPKALTILQPKGIALQPESNTTMSPTTDNFIHSLVEMSKAFEELPGVRAEAEERTRQTEVLAKQVQDREESILKLKAELEASHEARRKVEAERDDAELRFLELDEKASKTIHLLAQIRDTAVSADNILTPPRPEPETKPEVETGFVYDTQPQGQSEQHPTVAVQSIGNGGDANSSGARPTENGYQHETTASSSSEVPKSDANPPTPTAGSTDGDGYSPSTAIPTPTAEPTPGASSQAKPTTQSYAGKRYYDHPTYLTRDAWHAGGGTDENYDWRPGRSVGF